jgi:TPR repeat protein
MAGRAARTACAAMILWVIAPGFAGTALAGEQAAEFLSGDAGLEAYRRLDFAAARDLWLPLARRGDARAQTWIGVMAGTGRGGARDHEAAIRWLDRAAAQDYSEAEFRLGVIHEFGHGISEDKARARAYYECAARHGHVEAQLRLGEMYEYGVGGAPDLVRAHMWLEVAKGLAGNHDQALRASGGRESIAENMTPAEITAAEREARSWIKRLGGDGD